MSKAKKVEYEIWYRVTCPSCGEYLYSNKDCPSNLHLTCDFCGQEVDVD